MTRVLSACMCSDAGAVDAGSLDATGDRPASPDMGATDTGTDAIVKDWPMVDVPVAPPDVTEDRPAPGDGGCNPAVPVPCPCGLTSGTRECRADGTLGLCQCGVATDAGRVCRADEMLCGGRCVQTGADEMNCGACGNVCTVNTPHTQPRCVPQGSSANGRCGAACVPGWLNCNGDDSDGCEQDVVADAGCRAR